MALLGQTPAHSGFENIPAVGPTSKSIGWGCGARLSADTNKFVCGPDRSERWELSLRSLQRCYREHTRDLCHAISSAWFFGKTINFQFLDMVTKLLKRVLAPEILGQTMRSRGWKDFINDIPRSSQKCNNFN
jgi:hypothetical protein